MADIFNLTDTWNSAGVVFTAIKMNVTDTASAAFTPKLIDLQVGGVSMFNVSKLGVVNTVSGNFSTAILLGANNAVLYFGDNADASIEWQAAGVVKVTDGSGGPGVIRTPGHTVATLPAAATAGAGARSFVTDATVTTFASTVAGGGANAVPVYSDGTNWKIG